MSKHQSENNTPTTDPVFQDWQIDQKEGRTNELTGRQKDYNAAFMTQCIIEDFQRNTKKNPTHIRFAFYKFWWLCNQGFMFNEGIFKDAVNIHYNNKWTSLDHENLIRKFFVECHESGRDLTIELGAIKLEFERFLN
jgi:hypothetical protein